MLRHATYKRNEKDFATKVVEDDNTGEVTLYVGDNPVPTVSVDPITGGMKNSAGSDLVGMGVPWMHGLVVRNGALYFNGQYCRELGLNAFSLVTDYLAGTSAAEYKNIIDGALSHGVKIVRFAATPISAAEIISQMHGGTIKIPTKWSDLSASYRAIMDEVLSYAASKGIYLVPTIVWAKSAVAQAFGETPATAVIDVKSKCRQWMRAFIRLYVAQYKTHKAIAAWNPMNEPILVSGTYLTTAQANAISAEAAKIVRAVDPHHAIFSGALDFIYDGNTTRLQMDAATTAFVANNPDPLDTLDIHAYSDRAWLSIDPANTLESLTADAFTYGKEWMQRLRNAGIAAGKPFVMTEIGVKGRVGSSGQEALGDTVKFVRLLDAVRDSGVQLALVWNYRNNTVAGQDVWDIREGTSRGDAYLPLIKSYATAMRGTQNTANPTAVLGIAGYQAPFACATFNGVNDVNIIYPGDVKFSGSEGTVMLRVRKNSTPAAFARVIGAQNSGGTEGWNLLFDGSGGELGLSLRKSDNTEARNTFGKLPALANGEWHTHGFGWNATSRIDLFLDGSWFDKVTTAYTYAGKGSSVGFRVGTSHVGANGATVSVAGIVYVPRICTAAEHRDYHCYGLIPDDAVFIPLEADGNTIGAAEITPTTTSGAVTFGAA